MRTKSLSLLALALALLAGGCVRVPFSGDAKTSFQPIASPLGAGDDLKYVHGSAADDVWAAGLGSSLAHYDGASWSRVATPSAGNFYGVFAIARDDAWALDAQALYHWNGAAWTTAALPFAPDGLRGIWASGSADVWVSGLFHDPAAPFAGDSILHWNGAAWSAVPLERLDGTATFLWGSAPDDVWLLEDLGATFEHWDGARWGRVPVDGASDLDVWTAVWGASPNDVWAIGNSAAQYNLAAHWDGHAWSVPPLADDIKGCGWEGLWGYSARDVWAVGAFGTSVHWDGGAWTLASPGADPLAPSLFAVWGGGADLWGVGASGAIARHHQ